MSVVSTSAISVGAALSAASTPERVSSTGNAKLIATAVKAAARVLTTYSTTMVFMDLGSFVWHKALITKKNTKNGATAFRALTNKVPSISTTARSLGPKAPSKAPITRPMIMRLIRLRLDHASAIIFIDVSLNGRIGDRTQLRACRRSRPQFFSIPIRYRIVSRVILFN